MNFVVYKFYQVGYKGDKKETWFRRAKQQECPIGEFDVRKWTGPAQAGFFAGGAGVMHLVCRNGLYDSRLLKSFI
jgi:hypothetical protein